MCPMLNVLFTCDYGLNHNCGTGMHYNSQFDVPHAVISYIMNSIYQAYHPGEGIYDDANECQHGHAVEYIIMEIVRYEPPNDGDDDDDDDPVVVTIDIYDHEKTYNEMLNNFFSIEGIVDKVSELVL